MTTNTPTRGAIMLALDTVGHPLRIRILDLMVTVDGPISPREMTDAFNLAANGPTLGTVSYHVRALDDAGLIRAKRTKQVRGAVQHFYVVTPQGAAAIAPLRDLPVIA